MARTIQDYKSFDDAYKDEMKRALARTPQERILLLHKLIAAWMKFPRKVTTTDDVPEIKRIKRRA